MIDNKLFVMPKPKPNSRIRLFCFPFAGGGVNTYIPWIDGIDDAVEMVLIQPPGRGARIAEAPHESMKPLVDELMQYSNFISEKPYVFFGHSLGSRVAYALCCQLKDSGFLLPEYFIASGSRAPHITTDKSRIYNLPKKEFIEELEKLNGTPKEVLNNKELLDLVTPLLRADFKISDTYLAKEIKMPFPILVFHGADDTEIKACQLSAWSALSAVGCALIKFNGDHFFINTAGDKLLMKLSLVIDKILNFSSRA